MPTPTITALIADDVSGLRDLLKTHLRKFNCRVIREVEDGAKVINAIRESEPDLVFLDINMPNRDGFSILEELSRRRIHSNIWIVSGEEERNLEHRVVSAGARGFIPKPFQISALKEAIVAFQKGQVFQRSLTAIVADDEPLMCDLLKSKLSDYKCSVEFAVHSGQEVLDIYPDIYEPDVIFLDIDMPDMSGLDVLKYCKSKNPELKAVIVSAHGTFENVQTAMSAGADGFLVKPYSDNKLEQILKKLVA